jgi:hypothetical protein
MGEDTKLAQAPPVLPEELAPAVVAPNGQGDEGLGAGVSQEAGVGGVIVTSNTKLAATYLVFGYRLRKNDPFYWIDNYQKEDVDKYGLRDAPFKSRAFFNLVPRNAAEIESAKGIGAAFSGSCSQDLLFNFVKGLELNSAQKRQLLFLCSVAIAEGCREVQEKREYLFKEMKKMPPNAKWVRVWSDKLSVTFGRNASLETRTQMLSRL